MRTASRAACLLAAATLALGACGDDDDVDPDDAEQIEGGVEDDGGDEMPAGDPGGGTGQVDAGGEDSGGSTETGDDGGDDDPAGTETDDGGDDGGGDDSDGGATGSAGDPDE